MAKKKKPEAEFQDMVVELAHLYQWRVAHFRAAQVREGKFATPVAYDGAGFPDLVMIRKERIVFAELKRRGVRKVSESQGEWARAIIGTEIVNPGVEYHCWNPIDWDLIERALKP